MLLRISCFLKEPFSDVFNYKMDIDNNIKKIVAKAFKKTAFLEIEHKYRLGNYLAKQNAKISQTTTSSNTSTPSTTTRTSSKRSLI